MVVVTTVGGVVGWVGGTVDGAEVVVMMTGGGVVTVGGTVTSATVVVGSAIGAKVGTSVVSTGGGARVVEARRRVGLRVVGIAVERTLPVDGGTALAVVGTGSFVVVVVVVVVVLVVVVVDVVVAALVVDVGGATVGGATVVGGSVTTVVGGRVGGARVVGGVGGRNDPVGFSRAKPADTSNKPLTIATVGRVRRRRIDCGKPLRCQP